VITSTHISASGISADKITSGTLDASVVTVDNIDASRITTGSLSADFIAAGTLTADIAISGGSISAGDGNVILDSDGVYIGPAPNSTSFNAYHKLRLGSWNFLAGWHDTGFNGTSTGLELKTVFSSSAYAGFSARVNTGNPNPDLNYSVLGMGVSDGTYSVTMSIRADTGVDLYGPLMIRSGFGGSPGSHLAVAGGIYSGDPDATPPSAGDVCFTGTLRSEKGGSTYTVYGVRELTTAIASASFYGFSKGDTGGSLYTVSTEFPGVPSSAKALLLAVAIKHSSVGAKFQAGPSSSQPYALEAITQTTTAHMPAQAMVPISNNQIYIKTSAVLGECWLRCYGYLI